MQAAEKTPTTTPAKQQPNAAANKVYKYIHPEITESVFLSKLAKTQKLSKNNKTTKSAAEKIEQSKKAQDTPAEENKSVSNQGQVDELRNKKVDPKSETDSKNALEQGMSNAVPKSLEAMDDFKSSGKGRQIGKTVLAKVNSDVASVKSGFGSIAVAKAPAAGEKGTPLPSMEQAPTTEEMHLGAGVLPPIDKKELDTSQYVNQSDDLLKQEAISQEQLNMVDKGDLATANKERQNLQKAAAEEPAAIQQMTVTEQKTLNGRLQSEEKNAKADMQKHRQNRLTETGSKQEQAKLNLEKKREEVAKEINRRYEACQKSITEKLDALEKNSLVQFDKGQETATKEFENQVNSDIKKFKDRRYDRIGGSLLWLKDKIFGIDDFPEVKHAFDRARADFVVKIDALIASITKTNNEVIAACKKELEDTKAGIAVYVASLGPLLHDVGKKAQEEVSGKLKALGSEIEKRKEKMQQQLAEKREAAMQAIDKKIEKMKEALSGALSVIGKLLLEAAKKFFKWALEKLGVDAEGFFETLSKAGAAIKAIFKGPGKFFSNLIDAVKGSINDFKTNFKTYIVSALVDWLTGTMGSTGIQIPKEFTVKSVIGMLLQVLGLTWSFFRGKLVALIGEEKVAWAEKAVDVVAKFVTGGVSAVWDWIKEQAETIKNTFIDSLKDWLLIQLVKGFAEWIVSLLIPSGAILKLIQGIYKLVMWFVDNIQRILKWVNAVLNSLGNIALGAIAAAVGFIVTGIRSIIPAILDFFAKLLNISGIVEAVKKIIKKVSDPIHKAIDVAINWVVDKVKKVFGKGKEVVVEAGKSVGARVVGWLGLKKQFVDESGEAHSLYYEKSNVDAEIILASTPRPIRIFLQDYITQNQNDATKTAKVNQAKEVLTFIRNEIIPVQREYSAAKNDMEKKDLETQILAKFVLLSNMVRTLLGRGNLNAAFEKYHLEGLSGTYGSMPKPTGDDFTADHQPQAAILEEAAKMLFFNEPGVNNLRSRAQSRAANGFAINLHKIRHQAGRTYGPKGNQTKNDFLGNVADSIRSLSSNEEKRNAVVRLIKNELMKDVLSIRILARKDDPVFWDDLIKIKQKQNLSDKDFEQLKSKVRNQILAGEDQMMSQDIESLKK